MTKEQILKQVIEKAKLNGFTIDEETEDYYITELADNVIREVWETSGNYRDLIFSHQFAEAFWGDWTDEEIKESSYINYLDSEGIIKWQHQLQTMVLEKDPLQYLKKFL